MDLCTHVEQNLAFGKYSKTVIIVLTIIYIISISIFLS